VSSQTPPIPWWRRLAVRLSLVVVLQISAISFIVFTVWGLVPYWPFGPAERERFLEQLSTPGTAFGNDTLAILEDSHISNAERRARLMAQLAPRLGPIGDATLAEVADLLVEVQRARNYLSPLFVLAWIIFPAIILAQWLTWRVVRPVAAVASAAERVTQGDLSARVRLSARQQRTKDELSFLMQRFNTMAASLERLEHERRAMIADIAHELRTPLSVLQGQLDALADGIFPLTREEIAPLSQETELLSRLIDDLRTLSLAEARRLSLYPTDTDIAALLSTVVQGFRAVALERDITIILNTSQAPLYLLIDPLRTQQIIANILSNALRHTPAGGEVTITLAAQPETIEICVADSGPGIPEAALPFIFDRFYRTDTARSRSEGGSGLGLAIVKVLSELQGGRVSVVNRSAGGARVCVSLPRTAYDT
jgi:signal transduction histidine kinase